MTNVFSITRRTLPGSAPAVGAVGHALAASAECGSSHAAAADVENSRAAFSLVELLITMALLSLIVLALMAVFSSTQRAFRASVTQTDVLEGSRAAVDLITSDLRGLTPSDGTSNYFYNSIPYSGPVNFFTLDNSYADCSYVNGLASGNPSLYQPLRQSLPGSTSLRANVLNYFFFLGRENTKWTGVGYVVNATNEVPLYPLYRFYAETNITVPPVELYKAFVNAVNHSQWTNMNHVLDGVVHLTVRPYDRNGYWMTNNVQPVLPDIQPALPGQMTTNRNVFFMPPVWGEVGCYFYSNMVPAAVELELGVLEDRVLQRAESIGNAQVRSNYLATKSGNLHLFRQRVSIPNVDPSAYQ